MIENVPTVDELMTVSLRLYFRAWKEVTDIVWEWKQILGDLPSEEDPPTIGPGYAAEWQEYLTDAQNDLEAHLALSSVRSNLVGA